MHEINYLIHSTMLDYDSEAKIHYHWSDGVRRISNLTTACRAYPSCVQL